MPEPLQLGDFAELGRMLKYIDRHDSDEIIAVQKQEAEIELTRAEQNLEKAQEQIVED
ncbi:MAG: hypothetical protein IJH64_08960 [Oscillospiraceae bacterium]|nr:hypothetical protein [Oscillospiraceae bacterium]